MRVRLVRIGGIAAVAICLALSAGAEVGPPTATQPSRGGASLVADGVDAGGHVRLMMNKTQVLTTVRPFKRVSVGQPDIADVSVVSPTSMLITAKKSGSTQLIIWDENERSQVLEIDVILDLSGLQDQLRSMFPGSKIEVTTSNGSIVLRGRVPNLIAADQAVQLATPFGKVLNFLEVAGGQQVMLQVRFAEVSRSAVSALGINGSFVSGAFQGANNIGQVNPINAFTPGNVGTPVRPNGTTLGERGVNPSVTLFGAGQIGSFYLDAFVAALRQNNLLRVLAEPNLIAISGQEASFLAGGEFPIPVTQGGGGSGGTSVTVEYREFGVKLKFLPVVLGDGTIRLQVSPEVSDLDFTTAVRFNGFVIPGLTSRKVVTTIELGEGQTFAVAGLLNNSVTATKDVTPILGDLPVIGTLFRSVRYQRKETELVVLVTPRLVEPMKPGQVPLLPGEKWRHPSENELFYHQDLGSVVVDPAKAPTVVEAKTVGETPRFYGQHGFVPATSSEK